MLAAEPERAEAAAEREQEAVARERGEAAGEREQAEREREAVAREQEAAARGEAARAFFTAPKRRPIAPKRRTTSRHALRARSGTASIIDAFGAAAESFRTSELTEYAYALAKADRFQEAIDVLDMLDNPDTPRALNYRGYATRKLGRTDEGIGYYLKSVALDPVYPQVREYLGEAYVIEGKFDLAKDQLATIGRDLRHEV